MTEPERPDCLSGVYTITCTANGKIYVGSSRDITRRWKEHRKELQSDQHFNLYIQRSWHKYGAENFEFRVIEPVSSDRLIEREQYWIDYYDATSRSKGFNLRAKARSNLGTKFSSESRARMSAAMRKRALDPEFQVKMSAAMQKRAHDPEYRARMSESAKKRVLDPEWRANNAVTVRERARDPEWRARMLEVNRRKALDPEWRARMSAAAKKRYANARAVANPVRFVQLRWWY